MSYQDGAQEAQSATSVGMLLRAVGGWSKPSGRGLMMFRMLMFSSTAAAIMGLSGATIGGALFGMGTLGFAVGSSIGYIVSQFLYYRGTLAQALQALQKYPNLMQFHLRQEFQTRQYGLYEYDEKRMGKSLAQHLERSWPQTSLHGMIMVAYHSAAPALEELAAREEAMLIAEIADGSPSTSDQLQLSNT